MSGKAQVKVSDFYEEEVCCLSCGPVISNEHEQLNFNVDEISSLTETATSN